MNNYTQEEAKEELIKDVVQNIVEDIEDEDYTSIYALLNNVSLENLIAFLPERSADMYEIKYVYRTTDKHEMKYGERKLIIKQDETETN